jgi:CBS domain-containing protein
MICPHCGHSNLDGLDTCEECLHDLRTLDVAAHTSDRIQVHLLEGKVAQIPYDRLVTVAPSDSLAQAISQIQSSNIGQALVVERGKLVGILTERDLLDKVAGRDVNFDLLLVRDVMTTNPEAVSPADPLGTVINRMSVGGYRHVPIVDEGKPVGILSAKAVANYILSHRDFEF